CLSDWSSDVCSSDLDGPGRLHDLIIDKAERALIELDLVVLAIGDNRERRLRLQLLLLDLRQVGLGKREDHRDRFDLRDDDEAIRSEERRVGKGSRQW